MAIELVRKGDGRICDPQDPSIGLERLTLKLVSPVIWHGQSVDMPYELRREIENREFPYYFIDKVEVQLPGKVSIGVRKVAGDSNSSRNEKITVFVPPINQCDWHLNVCVVNYYSYF